MVSHSRIVFSSLLVLVFSSHSISESCGATPSTPIELKKPFATAVLRIDKRMLGKNLIVQGQEMTQERVQPDPKRKFAKVTLRMAESPALLKYSIGKKKQETVIHKNRTYQISFFDGGHATAGSAVAEHEIDATKLAQLAVEYLTLLKAWKTNTEAITKAKKKIDALSQRIEILKKDLQQHKHLIQKYRKKRSKVADALKTSLKIINQELKSRKTEFNKANAELNSATRKRDNIESKIAALRKDKNKMKLLKHLKQLPTMLGKEQT
jgi:chromosome segregation ATPase